MGSHRLAEASLPAEVLDKVQVSEGSVVLCGSGAHVLGILDIRDEPRPDAARAVQELRALGIGTIAMLTGDGDRVAKSVATAVGIEEVHADLSPDDKAASILRLRNRHGLTAMVGDGLNDAHADVGIAMGQKSSGIALETADVVLMSDSLEQLPFLVQHARRPLAVIRQNIIFALLTKAIFLLLAAGGCRYVVDGDGDRGGQRRATLLVILNGLRLLRVRSNMLRDADC